MLEVRSYDMVLTAAVVVPNGSGSRRLDSLHKLLCGEEVEVQCTAATATARVVTTKLAIRRVVTACKCRSVGAR